jgi:hypothetical protein
MAGAKQKEKPLRTFWKPKRALPSVEWDDKRQKAKFEFIRGVFETDDQDLCEYLLEKGYREITGMTGDVPIKPPLDDLPDPEAPRDPLEAAIAQRRVGQTHPDVTPGQ